MRLILALVASGVCVGLGLSAASLLERRDALCQALSSGLTRLEAALLHTALPLPEALYAGGGEDARVFAYWAEELSLNPQRQLSEIAKSFPKPGELGKAEWQIFYELACGLASPNRDMQLEQVRFARARWMPVARVHRRECERKRKLFLSLGALCGAALFLLLL